MSASPPTSRWPRDASQAAQAVSPTGQHWTQDNIGNALAGREVARHMREIGMTTGGPAALTRADRSRFLSALDAAVQAARTNPSNIIGPLTAVSAWAADRAAAWDPAGGGTSGRRRRRAGIGLRTDRQIWRYVRWLLRAHRCLHCGGQNGGRPVRLPGRFAT